MSTAPFQAPAFNLRRLRGGVAVGVNMQDGYGTQDGSGTRGAKVAALEATQRQILIQSPTDATRFWWHLYGS